MRFGVEGSGLAPRAEPAEAAGSSPAAEEKTTALQTTADKEEEALKTRGLFMSLDSDEFGIDEEQLQKSKDKENEVKEPDTWEKFGNSTAGLGALGVFTIVVGSLTYYTFFTKQAEDAFYYSAMKDRAGRYGDEDEGMDFRNLGSDVIADIKKGQAAQVPNQTAPEPTP